MASWCDISSNFNIYIGSDFHAQKGRKVAGQMRLQLRKNFAIHSIRIVKIYSIPCGTAATNLSAVFSYHFCFIFGKTRKPEKIHLPVAGKIVYVTTDAQVLKFFLCSQEVEGWREHF